MKKELYCDKCINCIYLGDGDMMCDVNNKMIADDCIPTKNYMWCKGKEYEEES